MIELPVADLFHGPSAVSFLARSFCQLQSKPREQIWAIWNTLSYRSGAIPNSL